MNTARKSAKALAGSASSNRRSKCSAAATMLRHQGGFPSPQSTKTKFYLTT
nr:MAG TPA: hypothetical protein [Caudoviricetes sp.]